MSDALIRDTIKDHAFFKDMKPEHLNIVAWGAKEQQFNEGDVIFREGQPANNFFLIETGKVAIEAHHPGDGHVEVERLAEGDVVGWSWLFPPFVWHFRARAIEPSKVIVLDGAHMLARAEADKGFGHELMKRVAQLVIRRLQATRVRMLANEIQTALAD